MAKSELKDLLHRYLTGNVTERERIKFETWLEMMKSDQTLPRYLSAEEEKELADRIMAEVDGVDEIKSYRPEGDKPKSIFFDFRLRIAATVVVLIGVGIIVWSLQRSKTATEWYAGGGDQKISLNDGSIVWLKSGSRFSFDTDSKRHVRTASLTGEGLFEIAKDPSNPFSIVCGQVKVTVVGTSFTLKTITDGIDLHLITGKVSLSSGTADPQVVMPFEHAVYKIGGELQKDAFTETELPTLTAHTEYLMTFKNAPLKEVFEKLQKKFDVQVDVTNPRMTACRVNADFTDYSLEKTMQLLKAALLDFDYVIEGKSIKVSGNGCNSN
jgi:transmembrane sensor